MDTLIQSSIIQKISEEYENFEKDDSMSEITDTESEDLPDVPIDSSSSSDSHVCPSKRSRVTESDSNDEMITQNHNFNTQSSSSLDLKIIHPGCATLQGKDGYKWSTNPRTPGSRSTASDSVYIREGPQYKAKDLINPIDIFFLFINDQMLEQVLVYTNLEITTRRLKYARQTKRIDYTTMNELKALLGLLLLSAVLKNNHLPTRMLFNSTYSSSRFKACMSYDRFETLLKCLRFDDKLSRPIRKVDDKFAAFRTIWDNFIENCKTYYSPSSYVTIDEQLVGFHGQCPFRTYTSNKSNKYSIKIGMIADTKTKYVFNAVPYLHKEIISEDFYVKKLSEPIHGSNRTLIMDDRFTSVLLATELTKPPYNLTMVGVLQGNKRQIPKELYNTKIRKVGTSMFCFDGDVTLVSYKPDNNKVIYLLSTTHDQPSINPVTGKPEIIEFYNSTKEAIKTNKMYSSMSMSRRTKRWPLCLFYNMLNLTIINAYVTYVCNTQDVKKSLSRRDFVLKIAEDLMNAHLFERFNILTLRRDVKESIREILHIEQNSEIVEPQAGPSRKVCALCPSKSRKMTTNFCVFCKKAICRAHNVNVCSGCVP